MKSHGWAGGFWKSITRRCQALGAAWTKGIVKSRRSRRTGLSQLTLLKPRTLLSAFVVNSAADNTTSGDGLTTLREAIALANANPGADTITFGDGTSVGGTNFTDSTPDTIALTLGQLEITDSVTITGLSALKMEIDAQLNSRIFDITSTAGDVTIEKLTLRNGRTTGDHVDPNWDNSFHGGAIRSFSLGKVTIRQSSLNNNSTTGEIARGGAIYAWNSEIVVIQSTVSGNSTLGRSAEGGAIYSTNKVSVFQSDFLNNSTAGESASGGAILSWIDVSVDQSRFSNNSTAGQNAPGGAILNVFETSRITITRSTFSDNFTLGQEGRGGAIFGSGDVTVNQSTFSGNSTAGYFGGGGALFAMNETRVIQSTISGNSTTGDWGRGGGLFVHEGPLLISQSTITGNRSAISIGGGVFSLSAAVTIQNSIVAGNSNNLAPDVQRSTNSEDLFSVQSSLIGNSLGAGLTATVGNTPDANGNFVGSGTSPINPFLGPLRNNGGGRLTHAPQPGSLAIGSGNVSLIPLDVLDLDGDLNLSEPVPFDQRGLGYRRFSSSSVAMGALEVTPPVVTLTNRVVSMVENTNTSSRKRVADIDIFHDGLGINVLSLTGADAASFEIVGNQLFLKAGVVLNFEAKATYLVTVNVDDTRFTPNPDSSTNFTLNVANVAEAPVVSGPLNFSFEEFSPRWTSIGKLNVTDPDGDALTYSIISGNFDNTLFLGDGSVPADGGRLWVYQQDLTGLRQRGMFNLKVRITDNSPQALTTDVDVQIRIIPTQNGSTKLTPSVNGAVSDATGNGFDSGDTVNSAGAGMLVRGGTTPSRGVIEFDLRSMPTNRSLKNAWLFFSTSALVGGATVSVPIDIFGYAGDGALSAADASLGTKIGTRPISNADGSNQLKVHSAPLDSNFVRTLIGQGRLGLVLRSDGTSDGVVINTSESSVTDEMKPTLVLQFGDLQPDLIIRDHGATGTGNQFLALASNGSSFTVNTANVFAAGNWERFLTGDFNGDGRTDIAGRLSTDGTWWISLANSSGIHQAATQWGTWSPLATWNDVLAADFDGDGKTDIAGRVANGDWWVSRSTGSVLSAKLWGNWSSSDWSDVSVGDFNRDGRADIAGRNILGEWFVSRSTGTSPANAAFVTSKWGQWNTATNWSNVQIGDFNGDGRTDIAGRSSLGQWWVNRSTGSSFGASLYYGMWSTGTTWNDVRVADFNGDGRDDIIGRTTIGQWWVAETAVTASFTMKLLGQRTGPQNQWGETVIGDFNRDGRADIATRNTIDNSVWVSLWTMTGSTPSFVTTQWATLPTVGSPQWRLLKSGRLNG